MKFLEENRQLKPIKPSESVPIDPIGVAPTSNVIDPNATIPVPTGRVNLRTGEPEPPSGSGLTDEAEAFGKDFNPLDEAVRSKTVIEGTTRPVETPYEGIVTTKTDGTLDTPRPTITHEIDNPGIEPRLTDMLKRQKQLEMFDEHKELEGLSKADLEDLAEDMFTAQQQANFAKKKIAETPAGKKERLRKKKFAQTKSTNWSKQSNNPNEPGFKHETERGDFSLQELQEIDLSKAHRKIKGEPGTGSAQKLRDANKRQELGLTGEDVVYQDAIGELKFQMDTLIAHGVNDIEGALVPSIKLAGREIGINDYIQDVFKRFNDMFEKADFQEVGGGKLIQGSSASKLQDIKKQLTDLAKNARNPNINDENRKNILKAILKIDNELTGSNAKFSELGNKTGIPQDVIPDRVAKEFDDASSQFGEAVSVSNRDLPDANISFQGDPGPSTRSLPELIRQRITEAQQGPGQLISSYRLRAY